MKKKGLGTSVPKTHNVIFDKELISNGISRRSKKVNFPNTKKRLAEQDTILARRDRTVVDFDPFENNNDNEQQEYENRNAKVNFTGAPVPLVEEMKVLGVTIDRMFTLDTHHKTLLSRAQMRQSILNKISSTKWGLEVGILKMSYETIVSSLLRFALVPVGSSYPDDLFWSMETNMTNVAARKITGLPRSA